MSRLLRSLAAADFIELYQPLGNDKRLLHTYQIKCALGVGQVASTQSNWLIPGDDKTKGHQIDLVIDRADRVVNLCEMKCYNDEFAVTAEYAMTIRSRVNAIKDHVSKRSSIQPTLVTTFGLKPGKNSSVFTRTITLDDLFK